MHTASITADRQTGHVAGGIASVTPPKSSPRNHHELLEPDRVRAVLPFSGGLRIAVIRSRLSAAFVSPHCCLPIETARLLWQHAL